MWSWTRRLESSLRRCVDLSLSSRRLAIASIFISNCVFLALRLQTIADGTIQSADLADNLNIKNLVVQNSILLPGVITSTSVFDASSSSVGGSLTAGGGASIAKKLCTFWVTSLVFVFVLLNSTHIGMCVFVQMLATRCFSNPLLTLRLRRWVDRSLYLVALALPQSFVRLDLWFLNL